MTEHPLGQPRLYDGPGALISYENGECTLGIIVRNAWCRIWTSEESNALVLWNDGTISGLHRSYTTSQQQINRTLVLISA